MGNSNDIHDFEMGVGQKVDNENAVTRVIELIDKGELSQGQVTRILSILSEKSWLDEVTSVDYGADFDLNQEIGQMIGAVRALRARVFVNGKLAEGISVKEAKEVINMANPMINTLMKNQKELMSMDRHRAIEQATVDCLKELAADIALLEKAIAHAGNDESLSEDSPIMGYFFENMNRRLEMTEG
ncbi:MAG: hypothetical protein KDD43_15325 [Bdellovibrionales bacterium]|nr:hypothetical protein [Bdellovibrionales bacterium]